MKDKSEGAEVPRSFSTNLLKFEKELKVQGHDNFIKNYKGILKLSCFRLLSLRLWR